MQEISEITTRMKWFLFLLFVLVLMHCAYRTVLTLLMGHLVLNENISPMEYERVMFVRGALLRTEKTVYAPRHGRVTPLRESGERVPVGAAVLELEAVPGVGVEIITAPKAGKVSYEIGPHELAVDQEEGLEKRLEEVFSTPPGGSLHLTPGAEVKRGSPLFRMIDNHRPLVVAIRLSPEDFERLSLYGLDVLNLRLGNLEHKLRATFKTVYRRPGHSIALYRLEGPPDSLYLADTELEVQIVVRKSNVASIPLPFLHDRGERQVVYFLQGHRLVAGEVGVLDRTYRRALVFGLQPDMVVMNPYFTDLGEELLERLAK